jgi:hypothetical protein
MVRASLKSGTDVLRSAQADLHGKIFPAVPFSYGADRAVPLASAVPRGILSAYDAPFLGGGMQSAFASWIGQPVVLQVALGDIKVPLRGKLLKEGGDTLRVRIGEGWDVDIYKTMVLAVEEDAMATVAA